MPRLREVRPTHEPLLVLLNGTLSALGKGTEDAAVILSCSAPTARKKLGEPGGLTIDELLTLSRGLGIPIDKIRAAISER